MSCQPAGELQLQESGLHRGRGEWTDAQQFVNRDRLGAEQLEQHGTRGRDLPLARIGGRAPSRGELTQAESRIAELVAKGGTNREVAAALFLTEHSVETALTRVYRKLGVRSRSELASHFAANT